MLHHYLEQLPDIHIKRALFSVSDKTGILPLARRLQQGGVQIISTGGTARALKKGGISVTDVAEITRFEECFDGRVKTLHPHIHGALLARPHLEEHARALRLLDIHPIQLLVVNLYPFQQAIEADAGDIAGAIENIDIGGPAMLRAAAKNFEQVCVLSDPDQYKPFLEEYIRHDGYISGLTRSRHAVKLFEKTSAYDAMISGYLRANVPPAGAEADSMKRISEEEVPSSFSLNAPIFQELRYGENPHQQAAVYGNPDRYIDCFHGKQLSYNNFMDIDTALQLGVDFPASDSAFCAIIKHNLPCGAAIADDCTKAWEKAFSTDTISPFGGIILFNRKIDKETAEAADEIFSEIILAPDFSDEALSVLTKKANRRLVKIKNWPDGSERSLRSITGGFLLQNRDYGYHSEKREVVSKVKPDAEQLTQLEFAWKIAKHVTSNAIVYAGNGQTLGIGAGQPSRVQSSLLAIKNAERFGHSLKGSVLASDAFFPFSDGVEEAARAGVSAIIQPGGSVRDQEVIKMADKHHLVMIFSGKRHFRH